MSTQKVKLWQKYNKDQFCLIFYTLNWKSESWHFALSAALYWLINN